MKELLFCISGLVFLCWCVSLILIYPQYLHISAVVAKGGTLSSTGCTELYKINLNKLHPFNIDVPKECVNKR